MQNVLETKNKLNQVSPSFCLAKWTSVSLHLESGTTHSCHHPKVHPIPLAELMQNTAALHNTQFKIEQRKKMLKGVRPAECEYCWKIEDLSTNEVSDRVLKSGDEWSWPQFDKILDAPLSEKFKPSYLEISFSNSCQFKCSYCSADYSSSWQEELQQFGPYPTLSGAKNVNIFEEKENPYVRAFLEWWPELKKDLHTFRITGGEPLLSPTTFTVLENLLLNPEPKLEIIINTNLGSPPVLIEKFIELISKLVEKKAVARLQVYTSLDAFGKKAEYIRHGLKHDIFWKNLEAVMAANNEISTLIMCTFNALSITSYIEFLNKIMDVNFKYRNSQRPIPIVLDISYLRHPEYQNVRVLPPNYVLEAEKIYSFLQQNQSTLRSNKTGFSDYQLIKFKRIIEWMKGDIAPQEKLIQQKRFYDFFSEHDRRRNTNFLETFPEMKEFWELCKLNAALPMSQQ